MEINHQNLAQKIEALLFALGKPLSRADLARTLEVSVEDINAAAAALIEAGKDNGRGIVLVDDGNLLELRAAPGAAQLIERVRREEWSRDLGRAGGEVLAILLYRGPATRAEIDFIRGVNSTQALRTLSIRGLVRRSEEKGARAARYELTGDFLASIGVSQAHDAPQYDATREKLNSLRERPGV